MKNKILQLADWCEVHWLALVIILSVVMMIFLCLVLFSWLYGYWSNGLTGTRFEVNSCWTGVGAIAAGIVTVIGLAKAAWTKYAADSRFNTPMGQMPHSVINKGGNNDVG